MRSIDLVSMGARNLWRRKLRTFLTILGVIIGTASIVIMVSLGFGMNDSFMREISRMGSLHIITVNPPYMWSDSPSRGNDKPTVLDDKSVAEFTSLKGVEAVTPVLTSYFKISSGRYVSYASIKGIDPEAMKYFEFEATEGRLLEEGDALNVVFGSYVTQTFYDSRSRGFYRGYGGGGGEPLVNVMEDRLELTFESYNPDSKPPKPYRINGVGVLKEGDYNKDYYIFMSIHQLKKLIDENNKYQKAQGNSNAGRNQQQGYNEIMVKVKEMKDVTRVQNEIRDMGYDAYSLTDFLESMQKQASVIQAVLGGIGAISLLVAALGITNTMIMSIYERTREIGVMKVIGATLPDIRRLFLLEAGIIGLAGGFLGIGISYGLSYALNSFGAKFISFMGPVGSGGKISIIPLWLSLATIVFTTIVGLVSGFYPARRAMKLSALEAIKTE